MSKQQQFLMIVQTMFLANAINQSLEPEHARQNRHEFSRSAAYMFMDDAIYASERIPENMTASIAAHEYAENWFSEEPTREAKWFSHD